MPALAEVLARGMTALEERAGPDARLEAEVLLGHAAGLDRARLYGRLRDEAAERVLADYEALLGRRMRGEPLAYLTGHREFFGLDFLVDGRVLIPRPETELLVETALEWLRARAGVVAAGAVTASVAGWTGGGWVPERGNDVGGDRPNVTVADMGTGSGAIAVSLAVHSPHCLIYATDVSADALAVAAENARRHGVADRVRFLSGDLAEPLPGPVDLVVANLPYVREDLLPRWCGAAQVELAWEPQAALDGGPDGLEVIRRLLERAPGRLRPGGAVLLETAWDQGEAVAGLARRSFPDARVEVRRDLAGLDRMVAVFNR